MNVTLCNNYTPTGSWKDFGERTSKMMDDYATANGYSRVCVTERISDTKWMGWDKIKLCINLLPSCDVLFCLDSDLLVMNHNVTVEQYLDDDHDMYIPRDLANINVGVIILKNTGLMRQFLEYVWDYRKKIPDEFQSEQTAWWEAMKAFNFHRMKILPQKGINSYPYDDPFFTGWLGYSPEPESGYFKRQFDSPTMRHYGNYTKGDLILHMPGIPMDRRYEYLNRYENKVIRKYK
jgi:hypothetical protein